MLAIVPPTKRNTILNENSWGKLGVKYVFSHCLTNFGFSPCKKLYMILVNLRSLSSCIYDGHKHKHKHHVNDHSRKTCNVTCLDARFIINNC